MRRPAEIAIPAHTDAIPLYGAAQPTGQPEQWESMAGGRIVRNVVSPTLTPVLPDPAKATGLAAIVAPGGAFRLLAIDIEGYEPARWLADHGVAAFVLKYRVLATPRVPGAGGGMMPGGPGGPPPELPVGIPRPGGDRNGPAGLGAPADAVTDARTAVRLVRSRAAEWKIDPARVGLLGFSAGAVATLEIGLGTDKNGRPDFIASIYGPLASRTVPGDAPPMFAVLASDDPIMGSRGFDLVSRYCEAKRPVEFHLYEEGGHAFGIKQQGTTSDLWIGEFYEWLKDRGLLAPAAK